MTRREWIVGLAALFVGVVGCGKKAAEPPSKQEVAEFFSAVQDGDADIVRRLLKAKPGLSNATNESGQTALQVARTKNNDELADVLKQAGSKD